MALSGSLLARLPLSTAMFYLGVGVLIGPHALGLITVDPVGEAEIIDPTTAPAYMARSVLGFIEQLERIGEVAVMLLIGAMLSVEAIPATAIWFVPLLLLVIRPVAVNLGMIGSATTPLQRAFISWFGIRGIGSIYYLTYAIAHGLPGDLASWLTGMTLAVVVTSVVVHGVSVTPLMRSYDRNR